MRQNLKWGSLSNFLLFVARVYIESGALGQSTGVFFVLPLLVSALAGNLALDRLGWRLLTFTVENLFALEDREVNRSEGGDHVLEAVTLFDKLVVTLGQLAYLQL